MNHQRLILMESLKTIYDRNPQNSIPETVTKTVKNRLKRNSFKIIYFADDTIKAVPQAKFGNTAYAHRQKGRALAYQAKLAPLMEIHPEAMTSNTLLFTGTTEYQKNSPRSTREALERVKKQWPKFARALKKQGLTAQIHGFECHKAGGFHVHAVLVFDRPLKFFRDRKGKARHAMNEAIKNLWAIGKTDLQGVLDPKASGYVLKELSKSSSCEPSLKRIEAGETLKKNDANRVWLAWLVEETGCRTFGHSENLAITDEEIDEAKEAEASRLDSNRTNSTEEKPEIVAILDFSAAQVFRLKWFRPFSGKVDPESEMYRELSAIKPASRIA